jgi:mannose-6-phosphate isomerase-like protein (cupin superfamily)
MGELMSQSQEGFVTKQLSKHYDYPAPDGSEIRLLPAMRGGGLAHCVLPSAKTSKAVAHRSVEEIGYCLSVEGEIWRKLDDAECLAQLRPNISITIPTGAHFQFRNTGNELLCILIATLPPWPGPEVAMPADGHWPASTSE